MRMFKVWSVLYPIGMYYVTEGIVFFFLQLFFSDAAESYMLRQTISAACTIPVIHSYYAKDKEIEQNVYGAHPVRFDRVLAKNIGLALFASYAACRGSEQPAGDDTAHGGVRQL